MKGIVMEMLLGMLGYAVLIIIGILIAGLPIVIAIIVRSVVRVNAKAICPRCDEKIKPQKTGRERVVGLRETTEEFQCPACGFTWWKLA